MEHRHKDTTTLVETTSLAETTEGMYIAIVYKSNNYM